MSQDKSTGNWIYSDYSKIKKIDEDDKKLRLNIHQKVNIEPFHYLSAIKMNSTYLEIANRHYNFYALYSFITGGMFFISCICIPIYIIYSFFIHFDNMTFLSTIILLMFMYAMYYLNYKVGYKYFKKFEYKSFYYLPIRFNRKNKKVYVFTREGEEKIYDWDELFFYIATVDWLYGIKKVELRAAKVDADDNIEFSFSLNSPTPFVEDIKQCLSYWEFIRHYMEDGPQDFYIDANSLESFNEIQLCFCNDIDQKLESYEMSKLRLFYNYKPLGVVDLILVAPIFYPWLWVRRYFMKYQAKIPYWSAEVNEACKVEENDPYIVDSSINKYFEIRLFPSRMAVRKEYLKND